MKGVKTKTLWPIMLTAGFAAVILIGAAAQNKSGGSGGGCPILCLFKGDNSQMSQDSTNNNAQLKNKLTPLQYEVTQNKATEAPFTGKFYKFNEDGKYLCVVCGNELFTSDAKYDSGCGWPSFSSPADENNISKHNDTSFGMVRTEVVCGKCGAHLGHVFDDGPEPAGLRYCINSAALDFTPKDLNSKNPQNP